MSKSTEIMDLIDAYVENHVLMCSAIKDTGEQSAESIGYIEKSLELRSTLEDVATTYEVMAIVHKNSAASLP